MAEDADVGRGYTIKGTDCTFCGYLIPLGNEIFDIKLGKMHHTIHIDCMNKMAAISMNYIAIHWDSEEEKAWMGVETV